MKEGQGIERLPEQPDEITNRETEKEVMRQQIREHSIAQNLVQLKRFEDLFPQLPADMQEEVWTVIAQAEDHEGNPDREQVDDDLSRVLYEVDLKWRDKKITGEKRPNPKK